MPIEVPRLFPLFVHSALASGKFSGTSLHGLRPVFILIKFLGLRKHYHPVRRRPLNPHSRSPNPVSLWASQHLPFLITWALSPPGQPILHLIPSSHHHLGLRCPPLSCLGNRSCTSKFSLNFPVFCHPRCLWPAVVAFVSPLPLVPLFCHMLTPDFAIGKQILSTSNPDSYPPKGTLYPFSSNPWSEPFPDCST